MEQRLYTTNKLAKLFGVVPTTVIDWIEAGKLHAFKTLGGHRRIPHAAVLDFLRRYDLPSPPAFAELSKTILILDDEPAVLRAFARLLRNGLPDVETLLFEHPVEALVSIGKRQPDLVIFDLYMPDVDGFEVCRRLKKDPGIHASLLAISGDSSPEVEERILQAGADRFLTKSDVPRLLVPLTDELLSQSVRGAAAD